MKIKNADTLTGLVNGFTDHREGCVNGFDRYEKMDEFGFNITLANRDKPLLILEQLPGFNILHKHNIEKCIKAYQDYYVFRVGENVAGLAYADADDNGREADVKVYMQVFESEANANVFAEKLIEDGLNKSLNRALVNIHDISEMLSERLDEEKIRSIIEDGVQDVVMVPIFGSPTLKP